MTKIENALNQLFTKHRIVFWYDEKHELREEFEQVWLVGVEKIEVKNNQFSVKHRILREEPDKKYLLFFDGKNPEGTDNWLLDVELANGVFNADQTSLWMSELGLGPDFQGLVKEHQSFFKAAGRRTALQARQATTDSHHQLRLKMMTVCLGSGIEPRLPDILLHLMDEYAAGRDEKYSQLEKFGLTATLWADVHKAFGYQSDQPSLRDFIVVLFQACYRMSLGEETGFTGEVLVFIRRWQDSLQHRAAFETIAADSERLLVIQNDLQQRELSVLMDADIFPLIDQRILNILMIGLMERTLNENEIREVVHRRSATFWYADRYRAYYQAIEQAAMLLGRLVNYHAQVDAITDGLHKYTHNWYQIDQYYRHYLYFVRQIQEPGNIQALSQMVEKQYVNNFLRPMNDNWQLVVDGVTDWTKTGATLQRGFYDRYVRDILAGNAKVAVVISDAMRYEVARELSERIEQEGPFVTNVETVLGMLPSYTQLGMAALLPNQTLEILPEGKGVVTVDGMSSAGLENRGKILQKTVPDSRAVLAKEIKGMTIEERRALFRENRVVYVYHNQIDAVGDHQEEDRTVDAAETTLNELVELVKALRNANYSKILFTSDHGFLYQQAELDASDFASTEVRGKKIYTDSRRYVAGVGLENTMSLKQFTAAQVGLTGEYEILIAKSINRLRKKGSGSRYVHGGASLQEIVIPVVKVSVERGKTGAIKPVSVDRISGNSNKITTGQITIAFFQKEPVSSKAPGRTIRAGIYAADGTLISDVHTLKFNFDDENARNREIKIQFTMSTEADRYNNQQVVLRLDDLILNTQQYNEGYQKWTYQLSKASYGMLFDDF